MTEPNVSRLPYRVVDAHNQGWHPSGTRDDIKYAADYGFERDLEDRSWDELVATRSPLRPVEPITDEDEAELQRLFGDAGRKTITTLAAALETVFHGLRESRGGLSNPDSYAWARRTLMAGREGSWESELLIEVVLFGNELNLAKPGKGRNAFDVDALRAAGPSKRVDVDVHRAMVAIFHRWVSDPDRYTEVAETLASVVSRYCDDTAGPTGWRAVADQWLQPGGLAQRDFSTCYRLFYSLSEHYDSGLT
jgi:hypothetical protein